MTDDGGSETQEALVYTCAENVDEGGLLDEVQIQCGLKHQSVFAYACRNVYESGLQHEEQIQCGLEKTKVLLRTHAENVDESGVHDDLQTQ